MIAKDKYQMVKKMREFIFTGRIRGMVFLAQRAPEEKQMMIEIFDDMEKAYKPKRSSKKDADIEE